MDNDQMYRMTEGQRLNYLMLLFNDRVQEAEAFRKLCDSYWAKHPDKWDKAKLDDNAPAQI